MSVTLRRSSSAPTKKKILSQTNKYKSPKRSDHEIIPYTCSNSLENLGLRSSSTKSHTHSIKELHEKVPMYLLYHQTNTCKIIYSLIPAYLFSAVEFVIWWKILSKSQGCIGTWNDGYLRWEKSKWLGKRLETRVALGRALNNSYGSFVLYKLPACSISWHTHELIVKCHLE